METKNSKLRVEELCDKLGWISGTVLKSEDGDTVKIVDVPREWKEVIKVSGQTDERVTQRNPEFLGNYLTVKGFGLEKTAFSPNCRNWNKV